MPNEAATKAKKRRSRKRKPGENLLKKLGPQHIRFIEEILLDPAHPADCAARAGYKGARLNTRAYNLQNDPLIAAELERRRAALAKKAELSAEWVLERLKKVVEMSMKAEPVLDMKGNETGEYRFDSSGANKALELLGKHLGLFSDKLKLSGEVKTTPVLNVIIGKRHESDKEDGPDGLPPSS